MEFGAYDGEYVSNTAGLADHGWKGLYIEPVPAYAAKCRMRHKCNEVRVIEAVVGSAAGVSSVHVGGPLTTVSESALKTFQDLEWAQGYHTGETIQVQVETLDVLLEVNEIPVGFDVLSVDVEGYESEVFKGFSVERWRPLVLIVELHDFNPDYSEQQATDRSISERLLNSGYQIVLKDFSNTVFLRS
ncbi:MAG: hypothetical protein Fues2KO_26300 [Fuerstiella sp.]